MEFLRYPHLITGHCNERVFGPPTASTPSSAWAWIGHTVSGLWPLTRRALNTRFPFASVTESLKLASDYNSPDHSTKGTRSPFNGLSVLVSTRFQVLFHSRYCSSIGHQVVFRLGWWSTRLPTGFHVSGGTLDPRSQLPFSTTGLSPSVVGFPTPFV